MTPYAAHAAAGKVRGSRISRMISSSTEWHWYANTKAETAPKESREAAPEGNHTLCLRPPARDDPRLPESTRCALGSSRLISAHHGAGGGGRGGGGVIAGLEEEGGHDGGDGGDDSDGGGEGEPRNLVQCAQLERRQQNQSHEEQPGGRVERRPRSEGARRLGAREQEEGEDGLPGEQHQSSREAGGGRPKGGEGDVSVALGLCEGVVLHPPEKQRRVSRDESKGDARNETPHPPDLGGGVRDAEHAHSHRLGHDEEGRVVPERLSRHGRLGAAAVHKRQVLSRRRRITIRCAAHGGAIMHVLSLALRDARCNCGGARLRGAPLRAPTREGAARDASSRAWKARAAQ
mmetsp:Transcript_25982/g.82465  ORF Transcript_25982/g.82465 Transcript_25982/m.82465 type:complete len:347 (+) Transcript_25982:728-1768(+)